MWNNVEQHKTANDNNVKQYGTHKKQQQIITMWNNAEQHKTTAN
jgi:hypothetical protein